MYAVSFIAAIETICAIANFSITDICNIQKWWEKGLVIVGVVCDSCDNVIRQFQTMFPNVEVLSPRTGPHTSIPQFD